MGKTFPRNEVLFPTKLMTCSKNYQFFKVLKVFLPAGFNGKFENYEPGKNIKTCDIADIVPAATDHFPIKNAPKKGENVGRFDEKKYEARFIEALQLDGCGGTTSCLYVNFRSYVRKCLLT